jgi:hypothetical protein
MTNLVGTLGADSVHLHSLAVPVLRYCLNSDEQGEAADIKDSFLNESLDLWLAVVRNAPVLTADLESLFAYWQPLTSFNTHLLELTMDVLRAYALHNSMAFMQRHAAGVNQLMANLIADSSDMSVPPLMRAVETIFTLFPAQAVGVFGDVCAALVKELLTPAAESSVNERSLALFALSVCRVCAANFDAAAAVWRAFSARAQVRCPWQSK